MIEAAAVKHTILAANGAFLAAKMKATASLTKPAQMATTALIVADELNNSWIRELLSSCVDALPTIQASNTLYSRVVLTPPSALPMNKQYRLLTIVQALERM